MEIKTYIKGITSLIVLATIMSCQDDIDIDTSTEDTNNSESVFTSKAQRSSMFDGSLDDVLDNSPCFAVQLPVNTLLNGIETSISTIADLNLIGETDVVELFFPITITNYDYTEIVVNSEEEFTHLVETCETLTENNEGPITCAEINFPIRVFTSTNAQVQNDFTLNSHENMYVFIENLNENDVYTINYPITVTTEGDSELTVQSDAELEAILDNCSN